VSSERTSELHEKHGDVVWNRCLLIARRNQMEAEDLFQEVWVRVPKALRHKSADAPDEAWLLNLTEKVASEQLRAELRRSCLLARYASETRATYSSEPTALPLSDWVHEFTEAGLAALSPRRRKVVELRFVEGLSTQETADRLEIATGTVKATLHAGRRELAPRFQYLWDLLQSDDL
jgi:RNA polymerase sigma-70 factor, ECF subfamily